MILHPVGGPLTSRIDSTLFQDDDGAVYYIWQDGNIARMKDDMTGFAEEPRKIIQQHYDPEPYCEGVSIFKHEGRYHLLLAIWMMDEGRAGYFPGCKDVLLHPLIISMVRMVKDILQSQEGDTILFSAQKRGKYIQLCSAIL